MSLATWKAEFYPVPASECPAEQALDHSIRKWEGLTPENLARHGVSADGQSLRDAEHALFMDSDNCALCAHYVDYHSPCVDCPIFKATGRECSEEFAEFANKNNPAPMLNLLRRVKEAGK